MDLVQFPSRPLQCLDCPFHVPNLMNALVPLWGLEKCPTVKALQTTHVTRNTLLHQNAQQWVWCDVQRTCFQSNSSSLLPSHSDTHRLIAQTTPPSLPSVTPLPPPKLFCCCFCDSRVKSMKSLTPQFVFRTQTSLGFVVDVALDSHA